uniref:Uncharacterized protein n=1 Tax=Daphnia galeata TaxID=27404 RepID=A0A8J2WFS8_9CRUS|nr:unnamed protein product [Daphnia galeata]
MPNRAIFNIALFAKIAQEETPGHLLDRIYVIRHEGAPHLRSASRKLSLHQRGFMDVILVVLFTKKYLGCHVQLHANSFMVRSNITITNATPGKVII